MDPAAASSDHRRRSLSQIDTSRLTSNQFTHSPSTYLLAQSAARPRQPSIELKQLTRGINGLPPVKENHNGELTPPKHDTDAKRNTTDQHVEVTPLSAGSFTDVLPSILETRESGVEDRQENTGGTRTVADGSVRKVEAPRVLPPPTVHDPYVLSRWNELNKLREESKRVGSSGTTASYGHGDVVQLNSPRTSESSDGDNVDVPALMSQRLRGILDLQEQIAQMHMNLETVGISHPNGDDATPKAQTAATTTTTSPSPDKPTSLPPHHPNQKATCEDGDARTDFEALERRQNGVMEIFDKVGASDWPHSAAAIIDVQWFPQIEDLSTLLRSFHAMPPPVLCFPSEATTPTDQEPPGPGTIPQTLGRAVSDSVMTQAQVEGQQRPNPVASRTADPAAVPQSTARTSSKPLPAKPIESPVA
jgi:hypothetical protein